MYSSFFQNTRHCILCLTLLSNLVILFAQRVPNIDTEYQIEVCGARCLAFCFDEIDKTICDECLAAEGRRINCHSESCPCYLDDVINESTPDWSHSSIPPTGRTTTSLWNIIAGLPHVHPPSSLWVTNVTSSFTDLAWTFNPAPMLRGRPSHVLYLVQINATTASSSVFTHLTNVASYRFTHNDYEFTDDEDEFSHDECMEYTARVATVTWWKAVFSSTFSITAAAGKVPSVDFFSRPGPIFIERSDEILTSLVAATPYGWDPSDLESYEWEQVERPVRIAHNNFGTCPPAFFRGVSYNRAMMWVHRNGFGCSYVIAVRAITTCGISGNWSRFRVTYNQCELVRGFPCPNVESEPPSTVLGVSVDVIPNLWGLWVQWTAPNDKGSAGIIHKYIIRYGICQRTEIGTNRLVRIEEETYIPDRDQVYIIMFLPINDRPFISNGRYGVQILPLGPGANSTEAFDMLTVFCADVPSWPRILFHRNNKTEDNGDRPDIGPLILYDQDGLKIYKTVNMADTDIMVSLTDTNDGKHDKYVLQWGEVDDTGSSDNQSVKLRERGERISEPPDEK